VGLHLGQLAARVLGLGIVARLHETGA
jgi:hypothetical protein